jgi:hypothetical protein
MDAARLVAGIFEAACHDFQEILIINRAKLVTR